MNTDELYSQAWQLLVHPDSTASPLVALDWLQESGIDVSQKKMVDELAKQASIYVKEVNPIHYFWQRTPTRVISRLYDNIFDINEKLSDFSFSEMDRIVQRDKEVKLYEFCERVNKAHIILDYLNSYIKQLQ